MTDEQREAQHESWERAAAGWARRADGLRVWSMPLSAWMLDHCHLQPGMSVLELAAGPADVSVMAAELVQPGGRVICSDASEAMLAVAQRRARDSGGANVDFKQIELDWIDLETASVDAVICRWGLMFAGDPGAALREMRRVLRPGGRVAVAVWDEAAANPWGTARVRALVELGFADPPPPDAPGPFTLGSAERLQDLLEGAGFVEVVVEGVDLPREHASVEAYIEEALDLSQPFVRAWEGLSARERDRVRQRIAALAEPFTCPGGALRFPGRSLAATAEG